MLHGAYQFSKSYQCNVGDLTPLMCFRKICQILHACCYSTCQVHGFLITLLHRGKIHYEVLRHQLLKVLDNM